MKTLVLFNNKSGVGKTTLVYHLGHMLARLDYRILAVDLDPQANLMSAFFDEDRLEEIWDEGKESILKSIQPRISGTGDIAPAQIINITDNLFFYRWRLEFEQIRRQALSELARLFSKRRECPERHHELFSDHCRGGAEVDADVVLIDVGPNLGAINRASLLSADYLLVPLAADLFSLQGLRNLGPTIRKWRQDWTTIKNLVSAPFEMPPGTLEPVGYVVLQHAVRLDRPAKHFAKWMDRIPDAYRESVLGSSTRKKIPTNDPSCLAMLRNYRSLMPMAQDVRKPMFDLRPADGAIGSHAALVATCYGDFEALARRVVEACEL